MQVCRTVCQCDPIYIKFENICTIYSYTYVGKYEPCMVILNTKFRRVITIAKGRENV